MNKKTIEHAASVLKEIKAEVNSGVIKDPRILVLCNLFTGEVIGFEVVLTSARRMTTTARVWRNGASVSRMKTM